PPRWSDAGRSSARLARPARVRLAMTLDPPIVLPPPEMLHAVLFGDLIHSFRDDFHAAHHRLADAQIVAIAVEEHTRKLDGGAGLDVLVIDVDNVAFGDAILMRTIGKNSVHDG